MIYWSDSYGPTRVFLYPNVQINPAIRRNHSLGHINSPITVRFNRPWLAVDRLARSFESAVFGDKQLVLFHKTVDPFPVDRKFFMVPEICPDAAIPPIRVFRFEPLNMRQ